MLSTLINTLDCSTLVLQPVNLYVYTDQGPLLTARTGWKTSVHIFNVVHNNYEINDSNYNCSQLAFLDRSFLYQQAQS